MLFVCLYGEPQRARELRYLILTMTGPCFNHVLVAGWHLHDIAITNIV